MVAAVPAPFSRLSSDSPSNSAGIYYPLIGRFQHAGSVAGERGSHASSEQHPTLVETVQQAIPESLLHQQTPVEPGRDGNGVIWLLLLLTILIYCSLVDQGLSSGS